MAGWGVDVLIGLFQSPPAEVPWWVTLMVLPVGAMLWKFFETQVWPLVAKNTQRTQTAEEREASAVERIASAMERIDKTLVALDFRVAQVERNTDPNRGRRIVRPKTEGERE